MVINRYFYHILLALFFCYVIHCISFVPIFLQSMLYLVTGHLKDNVLQLNADSLLFFKWKNNGLCSEV